MNHKYSPSHMVTVDYRSVDGVYAPAAFPLVEPLRREAPAPPSLTAQGSSLDPVTRARRYLARVPPAIAGEHGDVHTFRVCCRLVRGFALGDAEALDILSEWNARCQPPWSERDLIDKLRRARRYGREPIAALLNW